MKTLTEKELRELDALMHSICGWTYDDSRKCWHKNGYWTAEPDRYTTDPAAGMMVLEKCAGLLEGGVKIKHHKDGKWTISKFEDLDPVWSAAETLPLAICLFAKKMFTK